MQHFVIDDLPPEDQETVRKFYRRMGAGYAAALLLGVLLVFGRSANRNPDHTALSPQGDVLPVTGYLRAVTSEASAPQNSRSP